MDNAILEHLSKLVGDVKSMAGYLQTQLDAYYEQIQNGLLFSNHSRIVPIIHWQQKIKSANVITRRALNSWGHPKIVFTKPTHC